MEGVPCRLRAAAVYRVARTYYRAPMDVSICVFQGTGTLKNIDNRANTGRKNVDFKSARYPV